MLIVKGRSGLSVLAAVLFLTMAACVIVLAYHTLGRGSSRTLFSVQENRQLINLGRSALAEGYYELQRNLDQGQSRWFDWFTSSGVVVDRIFVPARTRENAEVMSTNSEILQYSVEDVTVTRILGLSLRDAATGRQGVIDLMVRVGVRRTAPVHRSTLTMVERRSFWFADNFGPFGAAGRHVAISPTPNGTTIEEL